MQDGTKVGAPIPHPDPVNTLCDAIMALSAFGLLWIVLTWAP